MSAALRRLPVLARRSAGAAWPAARGAAPALAAMGAGRQGRHLATLPALARAFQPSVQLLQQRRQWPRLQLSARSFSADVQPEGDAVEEVAVAAEPEPVAELPAPPPANRLFVHNIAWATTDEASAKASLPRRGPCRVPLALPPVPRPPPHTHTHTPPPPPRPSRTWPNTSRRWALW